MSCPCRTFRAWRTTVRIFARRSRVQRTSIHRGIHVARAIQLRTRLLGKSSALRRTSLGRRRVHSTFTPAQIARDKAFAEFLRGLSLGYFALFYDSAAVVTKERTLWIGGSSSFQGSHRFGHCGDPARDGQHDSIADCRPADSRFPAAWVPSPTAFRNRIHQDGPEATGLDSALGWSNPGRARRCRWDGGYRRRTAASRLTTLLSL